ncbi:lon protease [Spirochaetota bacterium]|nr:lon protease [Spirochaetota bacterium]
MTSKRIKSKSAHSVKISRSSVQPSLKSHVAKPLRREVNAKRRDKKTAKDSSQAPPVAKRKMSYSGVGSEKLPSELIWLPAKDRPPFPGIISAAVFQNRTDLLGIHHILKKPEPYFAFSYVKKEDKVGSNTESYHDIGCIARVLKTNPALASNETDANNSENTTRQSPSYRKSKAQGFFLRCLRRIKIETVLQTKPYRIVNVKYFKEDDETMFSSKDTELNTYLALITQRVKELIKLNASYVEEFKLFVAQHVINSPMLFVNLVSGHLTAPAGEELQKLLAIRSHKKRLQQVAIYLEREVQIFKLRNKIDKQVKNEVSKQQHHFFLREQLKYIKKELGVETDEKTLFLKKIEEQAAKTLFSDQARKVLAEECHKLKFYDTRSSEYSLARTYTEWLLALPWGVTKQTDVNLKKIKRVLDNHHYGIKKGKERILEFMAVEKLRREVGGSILCLVGAPGVGKTSLGRSIALATGRDFYRFSLGGMRDEAEIKGHRRTYIGALPGKFIQALRTVKTLNPVIVLDEIDKLTSSFTGDPAAALLEVLDKEHNHHFHDHYLDIPFDLSKVLFIATANQTETIPAALLDRMEVVELSGYALEEKLIIAKRYLLPKLLRNHGLSATSIRLDRAVVQHIITHYALESGVRSLEKMLATILRKAICKKMLASEAKIASKTTPKTTPHATSRKPAPYSVTSFKSLVIRKEDLKTYLGREIFKEDLAYKSLTPGVVCGLAWTQLGGALLYVEVVMVRLHDKGEVFRLTGNMGDVMMESAELAYSYVKTFCEAFFTDKQCKVFTEKEFHIHVPAGATPKDGPSAGVAIVTAILSVLLDFPIAKNIAMTGELTLTGQILGVGGVREKVIAAKRSGRKRIFLPRANCDDFNDIPISIRRGMKPQFTSHFNELAEHLFPKRVLSVRKS